MALAVAGAVPPAGAPSEPAAVLWLVGHVSGYGLAVLGPVAVLGPRVVADWRQAQSSPLSDSAIVGVADLGRRLDGSPDAKAVIRLIALISAAALLFVG